MGGAMHGAMNGAGALDPLRPPLESARRLQDGYSDEVLDELILVLNECNRLFPSEFAIVAGDAAGLTTPA